MHWLNGTGFVACPSVLLVAYVGLFGLGLFDGTVFAADSVLETTTLEQLYVKGDYQRAVEEISKLDATASAVPDIRRIKIRSLLRLGNPKEALAEYDRLERALKGDDVQLLREVALGFILIMVKDMREQMRGAAYTALKEWNNADALPILEDGLSDGSGLIRALVAEGLGKLEEGRHSLRFKQALGDQAALVKEAVLKGLSRSSDVSVVGLAEPALKDQEPRVRVAGAAVMCRFGRRIGCDLLRQSARAPNPDERTSAIRALIDLGDAKVGQLVLEASGHTQPSVRGAAAAGLAYMPAPEALNALIRLINDPLPPVRIAAAVSLGQLRGVDAVSSLKQALKDRDASVRAFVIGALLAQGERYDLVAVPVRSLATAKEPAVRTAVARALGQATENNRIAAWSAVMLLLQDSVPRVRIAAIKSAAKLDGLKAVPILKQGLHDEDDAVRATAGGGLLQVLKG